MTSRQSFRVLAPLIAILGILLLMGSLATGLNPTPSGPPSAAPSAPTTSVELQRAANFPGPPGSVVTSVTAGGPGFVAVGFDGMDRALVWVSTDGTEWTAVPDDEVFARASMAGVASGDGVVVAVGRDLTSIEDEQAAAWVSHDGVRWRRARDLGLDGAQMVSVVAGGPGFVAVGTHLEGADAAAVWTSVDGEAWDLVPSEPGFAHSFLWSVTTGDAGRTGAPGLVATGWHRNPEPSVAFWTSPDGRTWTRSAQPSGASGFQARSVVDLDGTFVAAGDLVAGGTAQIWTSADGADWLPAAGPATFEDAALTTVTRIPDGIIAGGYRGTDGAVWTSRDGMHWTTLDGGSGLRDAYLTAMTVGDGKLVAVGATQVRITGTDSFEQAAMAWFSAPLGTGAP